MCLSYFIWISWDLVEILKGKKYLFIYVDIHLWYTWVEFNRKNLDTFTIFKGLCECLCREKGEIIHICNGHTREFVNSNFSTFSTTEGISHEFSAPITPHENGVVKMKNRTLQEMTIVMVHVNKISILVLGWSNEYFLSYS